MTYVNDKWLSSHFKKPVFFFCDDNRRCAGLVDDDGVWPEEEWLETDLFVVVPNHISPHGCCNHPSLTERIVLGWSTSSSYYTSNDAKPRKRLAKMETHLTRILLALWFASMRWRCLIHHIFGSPCYVMRATNFKLGKGARAHIHAPEEVFLFDVVGGAQSWG